MGESGYLDRKVAPNSKSHLKQNWIAVSFPLEAFAGNLENLPLLPAGFPSLGLLTSAEDIPATADVKQLAQGLDAIRHRFSPQRPTHETLAHPR
jgi:hypothetical protein